MNIYDIVHIEEDKLQRIGVKGWARNLGLSYFGIESLEGLNNFLKSDAKGKIHIFNNYFSIKDGWPATLHIFDGVKLLREKFEDAKIIIYSNPTNIERIAEELHVKDFLSKYEYSREELIRYVKEKFFKNN